MKCVKLVLYICSQLYVIIFTTTVQCTRFSLLQVRLPLLPVEFLTGTVAKDEMIKGNLSCRDLMDEARNYHLHLSNKVVLDFEYSVRTVPRKHTAGSTYMVLFGSEHITTDFMASVVIFSTISYHLKKINSYSHETKFLSGCSCVVTGSVSSSQHSLS